MDNGNVMDLSLKTDIEELWVEAAELALLLPFAALQEAVLKSDITYNQFDSLMSALRDELLEFRSNQNEYLKKDTWLKTGIDL